MLANVLTGLRLILALPVALTFAYPGALAPEPLVALILLAIASDLADGPAARRFGTASSAGMLFDHGTDFFFVTSALFAIAFSGKISVLLPCLIVLAFSQYVLDSYFLFRQKSLRMSLLGRWNGVFYFAPLMLFAAADSTAKFGAFSSALSLAGTGVVWALCASTAASIVDRGLAPLRSDH